jgi:glycosyltransferase involved in cell wall biosynthesis
MPQQLLSKDAELRSPPKISERYLMAVVQMPLYRDRSGRLFAEQLWGRDLLRHLDYLDVLSVACPCLQQEPPQDAICLDSVKNRLEIVELPTQHSLLQSISCLPRLIYTLWKASGRAEIVHTGIAGWPIPMGWIVGPIALWQRKKLLIIVESAPWRIQADSTASWRALLRSRMQEGIGRWLLRRSDLPIFTQDGYRQSMLAGDAHRGFVIPASWIDEADVISVEDARSDWQDKLRSSNRPLRILYAGRLTVEKGLLVLLQSMRLLAEEKWSIHLDILGEGALKADCDSVSRDLNGPTCVRVLGTVAYGPPLFNRIREYHAVVVPSISDEQPRIVYDAYSQGVPVIASDTTGLRSCISEGRSGLFFAPGDSVAFASLLRGVTEHIEQLQILGMNSIEIAREMTHQKMHQDRASLIEGLLCSPNN